MKMKGDLIMKPSRLLGFLDLALGGALFLSGIYVLSHPREGLAGVSLFYGILAVGTGIVDLIFYFKMERRTGFGPAAALVTGILSLLAGVLLLFQPAAGVLSLAILFPLWFVAHCISELARLPLIRWSAGKGYYYFSLIINIIGLVLGIIMLAFPAACVLSLPWIAGIYLLLLGLHSVVLGMEKIISNW